MKTERAKDFERLWALEQGRILAWFFRCGCPEEDAKDLTQEVALRAWRGFQSLRGDFGPWVYSIKKKVFADYVRSRRREIRGDGSLEPPESRTDPGIGAVLKTTLARCMQELDTVERECLYYHDYLGIKYEEIGEKLGISRSNAHYKVENARMRLRELFPELAREYGVLK